LPAAGIAMIWVAWPRVSGIKQRCIATAIPGAAILFLLAIQAKPIVEMSATTRGNQPLLTAGFEQTLPFKEYFLSSIKEYGGYYLWRFVLPVRLSVDPDPAPVQSPLNFPFLISAGLLLGLTVAVALLRNRRPVTAAGIALILASPLSAYCLFPLADVVAEHRAYISFLGAAVILSDVLRTRIAVPAVGALLLLYSWLTMERNKIWTDELLLWQDASRQAPEKIRPHVNLGALYQARGQTGQAIKEYEYVLSRVPDHTASLSNLSSLYLGVDDVAKAEEVLNRAIATQSPFPPIYMNLAVVRMRQGRIDEARHLLQRAGTLDPRQLLVHHNLGDIFLNEGKSEQAIAEYLEEITLNPDFALSHLHLALAYEAARMPEMAKEQYRTVLKLQPQNAEARAALERVK